jgi:hypothetical protein
MIESSKEQPRTGNSLHDFVYFLSAAAIPSQYDVVETPLAPKFPHIQTKTAPKHEKKQPGSTPHKARTADASCKVKRRGQKAKELHHMTL